MKASTQLILQVVGLGCAVVAFLSTDLPRTVALIVGVPALVGAFIIDIIND